MCVQKKFVIERTRDLNYLKFVATDFSPKTISPSAGENSGDLENQKKCTLRKQEEASVDVPYPPLQLLTQLPLVLPSQSSLYSLSTIPYFFSDQFCPPKIKTSNFITFCFTNGIYFCISVSHHDLIMHTISL